MPDDGFALAINGPTESESRAIFALHEIDLNWANSSMREREKEIFCEVTHYKVLDT